ncbi:MAG: hypothetical protein QS748_07920 [Candidatus Endonucleobacter bathymodioli]|uniref:Uncharacterized protein n=1 Tax=Candidatus Endonucleibacter bathymodioli TaxID=539814 RepID=A0AA90NVQ9_9GAMM|nr:hypothetical protein [Candidatus Endonucleobacter bathymodioli]
MIWDRFSLVDFINNGAKFNKTCISDYKDDGKIKLTFETAFDSVFHKRCFSNKNNHQYDERHVFFSERKCSELRFLPKQDFISYRFLESAKGSDKLFDYFIQLLNNSCNIEISARCEYFRQFIFESADEDIVSAFETEERGENGYFTFMHIFTNYRYVSFRGNSESSGCIVDEVVSLRVGSDSNNCIYGVCIGDINKCVLGVDEA